MLMVNLKLARVFQHPTILIGHSYGGLVIKQLCLEAHTWRHIGDDGEDAWVLESTRPYMGEEGEDASVLNCIKGVFFYGTPHHGSSVFSTIIDLKDASLLLDFVHVLCAVSARLHQIFDSLRWTHKWRIAGVGELKPTLTPTLTPEGESQSVIIVHEASARYGEFTMEQEDHFSLCQPESRFSNTYTRLTKFIRCIDEDIHPLKGMRFFDELHDVPKMAMVLRLKLFGTVRNFLGTVPLVGLHGMDGVGKTTLAKLLFNNMCTEFEYTCFISGSKLKGDYQEMEENMYLSMYHYGKKVIRGGKLFRAMKYGDMIDLTQTKLLFVLDDIADIHIQFLREISSKFDYVNSRYIVTSQNKNILG
ncbi:hypothetical protein Mp_6g11260 [Marchantia polymorpha subsp. ruderalis]|uniref:NB-ARC domain-containing protein n=2 Tax=Marchantia polymorpha TaxID=3197 RepID=A0AAF6BQV5_MARPO|nr:hypothetical protein MARPO_0016s0166 [Marchantia polymorpha]BBN14389.1 hypothetical protein Mp_6g11260 [Marchantia polymorpha subsp. ruderalis]|eukprot:PTQ45123.1 hypothetical protein MARPO_0016s0166 [Marchantia polymorpha]